MKITPVDIQHKQFRKALQGYQREDVDAFLDEVIESLEEEIEERTKLEARVAELQEKLAHFKAMETSLQSTAHKEVDLIKQHAKLELESELAEVKGRIAEARRELQRHNDHIAQAKQDMRGFLARHNALLNDEVVQAADAGAGPSIPLPGEEQHEELLRESS